MEDKLGAIIIPAYNEAETIARTLRALLRGVDPQAVDIIVACNGCTDATVAVATAVDPRIRVLDLPAPGKAGALRAAEKSTTVMPRIYLDADTELEGGGALDVLCALRAGAMAARPPAHFDLQECSWAVRRFWRLRQRLGNVNRDLCGAGVYGLSRAARARFGEFPDITADDLFAARIVSENETVIVETSPAIVRPPRTLRSHVAVLRRVYRGNREFAKKFPELSRSSTQGTMRQLLKAARNPAAWVDILIYSLVVTWARITLRFDRTAPAGQWERDLSARGTST